MLISWSRAAPLPSLACTQFLVRCQQKGSKLYEQALPVTVQLQGEALLRVQIKFVVILTQASDFIFQLGSVANHAQADTCYKGLFK